MTLPRLDGMHAIWISVVLWILFQCAEKAATLYRASEAHVTMAIVGGNSVVTQKLGLHCRSTSLCEVSLAAGLWLTSASPWCVNATLDGLRKRMRFDPFRTSFLSCWQNACTSIQYQKPQIWVSDTTLFALGTLRRNASSWPCKLRPPC